MRRALLALLLIELFVSDAHATPPIPASQWTPRARLWLSRAQVAEAGWTSTVDHDSIAWALSRRWSAARVRYPLTRFVDTVRAYCAGMGEDVDPIGRLVWVRNLPAVGSDEPPGWNRKARWSAHLPLWRSVLERSGRWARGEVRDPSRGRADHWGGMAHEADRRRAERAIAAGRWRRAEVPGALNAFFEVL